LGECNPIGRCQETTTTITFISSIVITVLVSSLAHKLCLQLKRNFTREAAINAGLPYHYKACISANVAITTGAQQIMTGHANGTILDVPI
jgi:hypothetical protein